MNQKQKLNTTELPRDIKWDSHLNIWALLHEHLCLN